MRASGSSQRVVAAVAVTVVAVAVSVAACGDNGLTDPGNCEVVFTTQGQGANPSTGIRFINRLDGGARATVGSNLFTTVAADMGSGACEIFGFPSGDYEVRLQQCEQSVAGSTECTSFFGVEVVGQVSLEANEMETVEITADLF